MRLEEALKQTRFESEAQKALINIIYTSKWLNQRLYSTFKAHGLTNEQYNVLRILRGQKGNAISVNEVSSRMIDKMSNTSRLVDKLLLKGLVDRRQNKTDRRAVDLVITKAGMTLLEQIDPQVKTSQECMNVLTNEEAATMNRLLDKLTTQ
ncbi:MAG: MarR family transcriptional regulator [Flavobacteriales bacterium]|nr:MarR family transcriptional regulator [Flavobacteriales bacterium]